MVTQAHTSGSDLRIDAIAILVESHKGEIEKHAGENGKGDDAIGLDVASQSDTTAVEN